jgi:spore germination protein KC
MKRSSPLLMLLLAVTLLTGCWDRKEIHDVAILQLTAVDVGKEPGTLNAYIQIAIPKMIGGGQAGGGGGGKNQKTYMDFESTGKDLDELRLDLERRLSRDLLTTHRRIYMVGDSFARRGLQDILDEISRNPKNRMRTYIVVAKGLRAREMADTEYPLETTLEEAFREIISRKMKAPTTIRDFFAAAAAPGIEPIAAAYTIANNKQFTLESIAIFQDLKLVGYLERNEAMALISMLGQKPFGVIKLRVPKEKGNVYVQMDDLKVKRKLKIIKGEPSFTIKINASGRVMENLANVDLANPGFVDDLNKSLEKEVEELYKSFFAKLQKKYHADSAGLGLTIYQRKPKYWEKIEKDWPTMYKNLQLKYEVKANVTQIGGIGAPLYLPDDKVKK